MAKIFLSYSSKAAEQVGRLTEDLEALGHTVWFDRHLSGGQAWWNEILDRIRQSDLLVLAVEPASLKSTACSREYTYAADLGIPLLPVLVAGEVSAKLLPARLATIQMVDYRAADRAAAFGLARALAAIPERGPLPDPLPEPPEVPVSYLASLMEQIEAPEPMGFEQQSALFLRLKTGLRDPETADESRTLLMALRKRRDLLASIDQDIVEALAKAPEGATKAAAAGAGTAHGKAPDSAAGKGRKPATPAPNVASPNSPIWTPVGIGAGIAGFLGLMIDGTLDGAIILAPLGAGIGAIVYFLTPKKSADPKK